MSGETVWHLDEFEAANECKKCQALYELNRLCCPACGDFGKNTVAAHRQYRRAPSDSSGRAYIQPYGFARHEEHTETVQGDPQ